MEGCGSHVAAVQQQVHQYTMIMKAFMTSLAVRLVRLILFNVITACGIFHSVGKTD